MNIEEKKGGILVVGDLDIFHARDAKEAILAYYREHPGDLHLDFSGVEFMDSTGLGILIALKKELADHGHTIVIEHVNDKIKKVFRITELGSLFGIEDDHDESRR